MYDRSRKTLHSVSAGLLAAAMMLALLVLPTPVARGVDALGQRVRVLFFSGNTVKNATITIQGNYTMQTDGQTTDMANGQKVTVALSGSSVTVSANGKTQTVSKVVFTRHGAEDITNAARVTYSGTTYTVPGDVTVYSFQSKQLLLVGNMDIDDYLCGVVPYEVGEGAPYEAIKAQAVAARTFTMNKVSPSNTYYDLRDSPSDQVFRGVVPSNASSIRAVEATRGQVLTYQGKLAQAFYSASNGGQTQTAANAWSTKELFPYLVMAEDPYDVEASNAKVAQLTFYKDVTSKSLSSRLATLFNQKIAAELKKRSLSSDTSDFSMVSIVSMSVHSPKYTSPSQQMTQLTAYVMVQVRSGSGFTLLSDAIAVNFSLYGELKNSFGLALQTSDVEMFTVSEKSDRFVLEARRWGHGVGLSQCGAGVMAGDYGMTHDQILAFYFPGTVLTNQFLYPETSEMPTATQMPTTTQTPEPQTGDMVEIAGLPIVKSVVPAGTKTVDVYSAPSLSSTLQKPVTNGFSMRLLAMGDVWSKVSRQGEEGYMLSQYLDLSSISAPTPSPTVTPTPVITQAPATTKPSGTVAVVAPTPRPTQGVNVSGAFAMTINTQPGSSLVLRSGPSETASRILSIPYAEKVSVLDLGQGTWYKVAYDGSTGYVKAEYLLPTKVIRGKVTLSGSGFSLNLRSGPGTGYPVIVKIDHGATVTVLATANGWSRIELNGTRGFVSNDYLTMLP